MCRWLSFAAVNAVVVGAPALAATTPFSFDLQRHAGRDGPVAVSGGDLRATNRSEDWSRVVADPGRHRFPALAASDATSIAVALTAQPQSRVELDLQAMAGHRSFDTLSSRQPASGWTLSSNGNGLGVGTTGSFGLRLSGAWQIAPFISLDYNHIDTARFVNTTSPRPFSGNNADTGFAGTMGAVVSHRFGAEQRLRLMAYGAMVAASGNGARPQEFGSVGARLAHAIGDSGIETVWKETGVGLNYRLTSHARLDGVILQTIDRRDGDNLAAKLGLQIVL